MKAINHYTYQMSKKTYPNTVIGARYSKFTMVWLVLDAYPNAVIWLVQDNTLMELSDWCKKHTTLYANIKLSLFTKKITKKCLSMNFKYANAKDSFDVFFNVIQSGSSFI